MRRLQCVEAEARWPRAVGNARQSWRGRCGVALIYHGDWGTALGEATPLPGHSLEPYAQVAQSLREWTPPEALPAEPDLPLLAAWLEQLHEAHPGLAASARCALDSCLLDAVSRRAGVALSDWLAPGSSQQPFDACVLFDLWNPETAEANADAARARTLKVKIGRRPLAELEQLQRLVAKWPGRRWRVDANQSLLPETCLGVMDALGKLGVEFLEEPCRLSWLGSPRALPCPLALDESLLHEPELARRWLDSGHVAAVVIKPMLLGSIARTLRWVQAARAVDAAIVVSHLFDGAIAARLYEQLTRALATPAVAAGLGWHPGLRLFADHLTAEPSATGLGLAWKD